MVSYHLTVKSGSKGAATAHAEYISREGKYSAEARGYEDFEARGWGNMPAWSAHDPVHLWRAADDYERENGTAYKEIEVALPRELTPAQRRELVEDFIAQQLGDRHAYEYAIHCPAAQLAGVDQPHAHIMFSERIQDGIERDPAQYFKRYNAKSPEKGGCKKASGGKSGAEYAEELREIRKRWADVQNAHLAKHHHQARVDHRSLRDQGLDRAPEKHLGPVKARQLDPDDIAAILERRAAEGARERAFAQLHALVDVEGTIAQAKAAARSAALRTEATKAPEDVLGRRGLFGVSARDLRPPTAPAPAPEPVQEVAKPQVRQEAPKVVQAATLTPAQEAAARIRALKAERERMAQVQSRQESESETPRPRPKPR